MHGTLSCCTYPNDETVRIKDEKRGWIERHQLFAAPLRHKLQPRPTQHWRLEIDTGIEALQSGILAQIGCPFT